MSTMDLSGDAKKSNQLISPFLIGSSTFDTSPSFLHLKTFYLGICLLLFAQLFSYS
ncbi:uncharacterized protein K460DRAFT_364430 [Cucurbitaria berberidis CBS 394.84]|uniref:Uncharacterized protein n=1 Tax=Cucurbitaria berberidis CBS 394.84 TaxID=1168544 RepID=A0A9P4LBE1_9PLEO|nr:uncharacterized protein K460DRAFT_364430 [Cucurbitaria berberidis CBS 394.84]KAF1848438.1 hypothetical protein K460DRAFT_364430 [Cucurbitaria berberidis CBS 394.84]